MKKLHHNILKLLVTLCCFATAGQTANAQSDSVPATKIIRMHYYNVNNSMQYILLESQLKKEKTFTPQANKTYNLYLDSAANLVAMLKTDKDGKAKAFIPPTLKAAWEGSSQHTFIVKEGDEELVSDYVITKSKIDIDTANEDGARVINVSVMKMDNNEWKPAAGVELKVGFERLGGILSAGDEETYTTDSTGTVKVTVTKDSLPGNEKGIITIAARADDNETFGNLLAEKNISWGLPTEINTHFFDQRALWTTRFRTPIWLLAMAYSIVIGVWGTLIYLIFQVIKIRKLGRT
ncbi:MAG TPA: hypothetical protein PKM63_15590 [Panacibacter sp.]|nr:hypothetical protein [Panacibacter sp.]HNP45714.1 hypothetical protein [Panacibacter sp.]